ncbi:hypothetical protein F8O06_05360 [Pseudoclavibacter sp. CFCC 14310]|uniref:helicase associated domain-containing protein n=1 Tax=Pseudoclavibacter sp. CFCC 14310 TaxID=2615180 RepID=UPI0013010F08|nr:helicase associated domain-containing protein [Pseudoclavibacter sp. CFCC 14310]KAB1646194.1 hypothetical protein F8O06_05360 [Pseudoclavibacter sp. CFCC 14310]
MNLELERRLLALREAHSRGELPVQAIAAADRAFPRWRAEHATGDLWLHRMFDTLDFQREHGRLPKAREPSGSWLGRQRKSHRKVALAPDRVVALDEALPGWNSSLNDVWNSRLQEVVDFQREHGRLPKHAEPGGQWLDAQRKSHRKGTLAPDRVVALDEALPGWNSSLNDVWNSRLQEVVDFQREHGRLPRWKDPGSKWLDRQRQSHRKGTLSLVRVAALDKALPGWNESSDDIWDTHLHEVVDFQREHGRLPKAREPSGTWLDNQRKSHRKGVLSPDRAAALDEALPEWNETGSPEKLPWDARLQEVVDFQRKHGRLPKWKDPGGGWLNKQRQSYRKGALAPGRIAALNEALPEWNETGSPERLPWDARLQEVVDFQRKHGRLPKKREPGGQWLNKQRQSYRKGALAPGRIAALDEALPGWRRGRTHTDVA